MKIKLQQIQLHFDSDRKSMVIGNIDNNEFSQGWGSNGKYVLLFESNAKRIGMEEGGIYSFYAEVVEAKSGRSYIVKTIDDVVDLSSAPTSFREILRINWETKPFRISRKNKLYLPLPTVIVRSYYMSNVGSEERHGAKYEFKDSEYVLYEYGWGNNVPDVVKNIVWTETEQIWVNSYFRLVKLKDRIKKHEAELRHVGCEYHYRVLWNQNIQNFVYQIYGYRLIQRGEVSISFSSGAMRLHWGWTDVAKETKYDAFNWEEGNLVQAIFFEKPLEFELITSRERNVLRKCFYSWVEEGVGARDATVLSGGSEFHSLFAEKLEQRKYDLPQTLIYLWNNVVPEIDKFNETKPAHGEVLDFLAVLPKVFEYKGISSDKHYYAAIRNFFLPSNPVWVVTSYKRGDLPTIENPEEEKRLVPDYDQYRRIYEQEKEELTSNVLMPVSYESDWKGDSTSWSQQTTSILDVSQSFRELLFEEAKQKYVEERAAANSTWYYIGDENYPALPASEVFEAYGMSQTIFWAWEFTGDTRLLENSDDVIAYVEFKLIPCSSENMVSYTHHQMYMDHLSKYYYQDYFLKLRNNQRDSTSSVAIETISKPEQEYHGDTDSGGVDLNDPKNWFGGNCTVQDKTKK